MESPEPEDLRLKSEDRDSPEPLKVEEMETISSSADTSSQDQPNWSYEEQFKQVSLLYISFLP